MYYNYTGESYIPYIYEPNIIDFLEEKFVAAGWTSLKKESSNLLDAGWGLFYPLYTIQNGNYNITTLLMFENKYIQSAGIGSFSPTISDGFSNLPMATTGYGQYYDVYSNNSFIGKLKYPFTTHFYNKEFTSNCYTDTAIPNGTFFTLTQGIGSTNLSPIVASTSTAKFSRINVYPDSINLGQDLRGVNTGLNGIFSINPLTPSSIQYIQSSSYSGVIGSLGCALRYKNSNNYIDTGISNSKILYVNSGSLYYIFKYNEIDLRLECYTCLGFDGGLPWNEQPGLIKSDDGTYLDYSFLPLLNPFAPARSNDIHFIGDTNSFALVFFGKVIDFRDSPYFIMGGMLNKFSAFLGGQYLYSTFSYQSNYYIHYEGLWYGETIIKSMDHVQGYIDMLPLSSSYFNKLSGDLFLEGYVAGINSSIEVDNSTYVPIGVIPNLYKHAPVTPTQPVTFYINNEKYLSFRYKNLTSNTAFKSVIAFRIT